MKNRLYFTLILLTIVTLAFLPTSFAEEEEVSQESVEVNTSEYIVRLIYFIPTDREAQPDIDTELDTAIKRTQKFFADEMARHGFSRKTFRFETNDDSNAIVHHVDGKHNDAFYRSSVSRPHALAWGCRHRSKINH